MGIAENPLRCSRFAPLSPVQIGLRSARDRDVLFAATIEGGVSDVVSSQPTLATGGLTTSERRCCGSTASASNVVSFSTNHFFRSQFLRPTWLQQSSRFTRRRRNFLQSGAGHGSANRRRSRRIVGYGHFVQYTEQTLFCSQSSLPPVIEWVSGKAKPRVRF